MNLRAMMKAFWNLGIEQSAYLIISLECEFEEIMLNKPVVFSCPMLSELVANILWLGLLLLLASSLSRSNVLSRMGWGLFGFFWIFKTVYYFQSYDYFNTMLTIFASLFSFYISWIISIRGGESQALDWITSAAAICGILYFPFAEIPILNQMIIAATANYTYHMLHLIGVPVIQMGWNVLVLNGKTVEIVLACTAIESIALFAGVILSVRSAGIRRFVALILSTAAIYVLNIVRNAFVVIAYGEEWFGDSSFYIAHNVIAKFGSTIALLVIAYAIFYMLPELLKLIDDLGKEIRSPRGGIN